MIYKISLLVIITVVFSVHNLNQWTGLCETKLLATSLAVLTITWDH